jgi:hypothetical protein
MRYAAWVVAIVLAISRPAVAQQLVEDTREIKTLTVEQAEELTQHEHGLMLDGLTTLSPKVAKALSAHDVPTRWKNGFKCGEIFDLSFNGLKTISLETALALATHKCDVSLNGLTTISPEVAEALARAGTLRLDGLTTISDEAARALAQHEGELQLDGLTALSYKAAKSLSKHKGGSLGTGGWVDLSLDGLITLSPEAAKALAKYEGTLALNGLTTLSDEAAASLRSNPEIELPDKFKR